MDFKAKLSPYYRLLRLATKPGRTEFWLLLRVCVLGVVVVGVVGFVIRFVFALIGLVGGA